MDETGSVDEIAEEITGKKADALRSLRFFEGEANARQIRRVGDIPSGSMHHHLSGLSDRGLIEQDGTEHVGRGGSAKVWTLTARGEAVADEVAERGVSIDEMTSVVDEVDEFDERLARLQESHHEKTSEIEEEIAELRGKYSEVKELLDNVLEYFDEDEEKVEGEDF